MVREASGECRCRRRGGSLGQGSGDGGAESAGRGATTPSLYLLSRPGLARPQFNVARNQLIPTYMGEREKTVAGGWKLDPHQALPRPPAPTSGHSRAAKGAGEAPGAPPPSRAWGCSLGEGDGAAEGGREADSCQAAGQVSLLDRQGQVWPRAGQLGPSLPAPAASFLQGLPPAADL